MRCFSVCSSVIAFGGLRSGQALMFARSFSRKSGKSAIFDFLQQRKVMMAQGCCRRADEVVLVRRGGERVSSSGRQGDNVRLLRDAVGVLANPTTR
jgi:hypothetical protein